MNVSLVIPSRNNLKYVKFAYNSIRKHISSNVEIVLLDDASTDDTWLWMNQIKGSDNNVKIYRNNGPERVGHTVLYRKKTTSSNRNRKRLKNWKNWERD